MSQVRRVFSLLTWACCLLLSAFSSAQTPDAFNPGADNPVYSLAVQSDGKILVGGAFTTLGGQPRNKIARLNADGTVDSGFNPGANSAVYALAVQSDGKILVGGSFTTLNGQSLNYIARLNADGTLDSEFNPGAGGAVYSSVSSLAVQADGKILVGGSFTSLGGQPRSGLARLDPDGVLDSGFNPQAIGSVLVLQADGKILVDRGGSNSLVRLNVNGTPDSGFNPPQSLFVTALAVQADGKILMHGSFGPLVRLNPNGTLDSGFNPGANDYVSSLAVQADGKILVVGAFTTLGGQPRNRIARLNANGTLDGGFNPGADNSVSALAMQADGKILVGGTFTTVGGQPRNYLARLNNTAPASQSLVHDGSTITWLRGGTSPEVWRTSFEASTNGSDWTSLGAGTRIAGGWRLTGQTLPPDAILAARGFLTDGGAASWFVETTTGPAVITSQPSGITLQAETTASFSVTARGAEPLHFQWHRDGVPLVDEGNIAGALSPTLSVSQTLKRDEGGYSVVVTNAEGSVTSVVAVLTVIDPVITAQPASQQRNAGESVSFTVTAAGTRPLSYQWWKNGVALAQGKEATLMLPDLQGGDAGDYSVVVNNTEGSVTSVVARLTVIDPVITGQPAGQQRKAGESAAFTVTAAGTDPINYQWWKDGTALAQGTEATLTLTNLQGSDAGSFIVVVSNAYGSVTSAVAVLIVETVNLATVDLGFNPGADGGVHSLAVQADGKILVGGQFTTLGGRPRNRIARLNADGTLDSDFNSGADGPVVSLVVQGGWSILVGGSFTTLGGQPRSNIALLKPDGTLYNGFNPGTDDLVMSLAVAADGKILVGGSFTTLGGSTVGPFTCLKPDWTLNNSFDEELSGSVWSLAVQADGKILVGGHFTTLGLSPRANIARLHAEGHLDSGFNPGANGPVSSMTVQADGRILVGGSFTTLGGQPRTNIARLHADGTLDSAFNPGADGGVSSLTVQTDGRILVGGSFTTLGGQPRANIARLHADGTLDSAFNPGADGGVSSLTVQADGKILVGGSFTSLGGQPRNYLARLNSTDPALQSLAFDGSTITWLRGGSSPEVWRTTFEASTNGSDWSYLGAGTRIAGGWQLTGLALPVHATIRARGFLTDGRSSGGLVEASTGAAALDRPLLSRTNFTSTTATWTVQAQGTEPFTFQWLKDGVSLADGGSVFGATTASLTLSNLASGDAGNYQVVVSNAHGAVTSPVATLTILLPGTFDVWTRRDSGTLIALYGATYGGGQFVVVGYDGTILTSADGIHWSAQSSSTSANLHGVAYGDGLYVAVGVSGTILTSPEGTHWTPRDSGVTTYLKGVACGQGIYVAVGNDGIVLASTNAMDWTQVATNLTILDINGVTFGNGTFVAVGDHKASGVDGPGLILYSTNGVDWAIGTHFVDRNLRGVAAGAGQFIIAGNDGTILSSTDAVAWSGQPGVLSLRDGQNLRGIVWGNGAYVVAGNEGILLTSTEANSWTRWESGVGENLHGVAYGRGTFVVVGNFGIILQSGVLLDLKGIYRPDTGAFELTIAGERDKPYRVQTSTNLTAWTDLWTYTNAEAVTTFPDVTATNDVRRFYRVLSP